MSGRWCITGLLSGSHDPINHAGHGGIHDESEDSSLLFCFEKKSIEGVIDHRKTVNLVNGEKAEHFLDNKKVKHLPEPNYIPVEIPIWIKEDDDAETDWTGLNY